MHGIRTSVAAGAFAVLLTTAVNASAETYPSRPITIVVPFSAGSIADLVVRIVAEHMKTTLGQPIIVEDVAGAGGTIGVSRAIRAAPDGYTISAGDLTSHVSSAAIFPVTYDVLRDLEPVALLTGAPQLLVARKDLPANNVGELIEWLRENSAKASMALPNSRGSGGHLSGLSFQKSTGTQFQFVPYRGSPQAVQDLMGGYVDILFIDAGNVLPYVRSGQIKALGVTTAKRWAQAPEIPTLDEAGVPLHFSLWRALWVPAGTPREIIARLNQAVVAALAEPAVRKRLTDLGAEIPTPEHQTADALRAHHRAEVETWWPIIKAANITPE